MNLESIKLKVVIQFRDGLIIMCGLSKYDKREKMLPLLMAIFP